MYNKKLYIHAEGIFEIHGNKTHPYKDSHMAITWEMDGAENGSIWIIYLFILFFVRGHEIETALDLITFIDLKSM